MLIGMERLNEKRSRKNLMLSRFLSTFLTTNESKLLSSACRTKTL